jgi:hypothetical protein
VSRAAASARADETAGALLEARVPDERQLVTGDRRVERAGVRRYGEQRQDQKTSPGHARR